MLLLSKRLETAGNTNGFFLGEEVWVWVEGPVEEKVGVSWI
jgi:hypothetical protein